MRAILLVTLAACGGSGKPPAEAPKPATTPATASLGAMPANPCVSAYADYEARWRVAREADLVEVGFDRASVDEVIAIEVALLPTRSDLAKLRAQYTAVGFFLPDAPWPRALDAADVAIDRCGEEAPRP